MSIKKLVCVSLISALGLSTLTACGPSAEEIAQANIKALKEKEAVEKEANFKEMLRSQKEAAEYYKKNPLP